MNLQTTLTAIETQRAAWRAHHDVAGQLAALNSEAGKARSKIADLRTDNTTDAGKIGKALTEQAGILEITEARIERAKVELQEAKAAAELLSRTQTVNVLNDARESLAHYWHNLRCLDLIPKFREWMSPAVFTERANWLKSSISEIADEDARFDDGAGLTFNRSDVTGTLEANFEAVAAYLVRHQDELPAAFEFVANREAKIAAIRAKNQPTPIRLWELLDLNQPAEKAA